MTRAAGSTADGHTALQAHTDRHSHTPWSVSTRSRMRIAFWVRGSSTARSAAARTAGPRYSGSPLATGQAETQARHSRQSSKRSAVPTSASSGRPTRPGRPLDGAHVRGSGGSEMRVQIRPRVDRDIRDHLGVAQRLERDRSVPVPDVSHRRDARQSLLSVHAHRACPARRVMAGVPEDDRSTMFRPRPLDQIEHGVALRVALDGERLEATARRIGVRLPPDAEGDRFVSHA